MEKAAADTEHGHLRIGLLFGALGKKFPPETLHFYRAFKELQLPAT